jgi:hypothetical protein
VASLGNNRAQTAASRASASAVRSRSTAAMAAVSRSWIVDQLIGVLDQAVAVALDMARVLFEDAVNREL